MPVWRTDRTVPIPTAPCRNAALLRPVNADSTLSPVRAKQTTTTLTATIGQIICGPTHDRASIP